VAIFVIRNSNVAIIDVANLVISQANARTYVPLAHKSAGRKKAAVILAPKNATLLSPARKRSLAITKFSSLVIASAKSKR